MYIPEALSVFVVSHDAFWAIGGTIEGRMYIWQVIKTLLCVKSKSIKDFIWKFSICS